MHGSIGHIFFNMFALYSFGTSIEHLLGPKRFLNFYLITGLGALVLQMLVQAVEVHQITGSFNINPDTYNNNNIEQVRTLGAIYYGPMVGASGAIFGLLIAFGMLFPNAELMMIFLPIPFKAKYFIPFYVVLELFLGVYRISGDSVAHFAHLGGALFGFILVKLWRLERPGGYL